jgi:hypothetical protein
MSQRCYERTNVEWSIIEPLLLSKSRGGAARRGPQGADRHLLATADRLAIGGHSRALRPADNPLKALYPMAGDRRLGSALHVISTAFEGNFSIVRFLVEQDLRARR